MADSTAPSAAHLSSPDTLPGNPLLMRDGLPRFDLIQPGHVLPAVRQVLAEAEAALTAIERSATATWEATLGALDQLDEPFEYAWEPVSHLFGVMNSPELREAYEAVLDEVVQFGLRCSQSKPLYDACKAMRTGPVWSTLSPARQRILDKRLRAAELAGIGLEGAQREQFNALVQELSQLATKFSNNVLDATKAFELILTEPDDVDGLPDSLRAMAAQSFNSRPGSLETLPGLKVTATPEAGPWRFTLDGPVVMPFLQHCRHRALREQVYRAFVTRAATGEFDNSETINRILTLRQQKAGLLGFAHYADLSLATKMAPGVEAVLAMLEQLRSAAWSAGVAELDELRELARAEGLVDGLRHWDVAFYAERLREQRYAFTEEELRPYFPLERALDGLFELARRLFGIRCQPRAGVPVWHPDVRYFDVFHEDGRLIAGFYLDPYSRPETKRPGAWMDSCFGRRVTAGGVRVPVAHLVCNSTPPVGEKPSLMTFREVETLFHEFGHGLQHMLTVIDDSSAAGINGVEWDAVELPSQFMENWCYHRPSIAGIAGHWQTGAPLPDRLFDKVCAARTFRAGSLMLRQLTFGLTDLTLHAGYRPPVEPGAGPSVLEVQRAVLERTSVLPMLPEDRSLCSFTHIFAGGYAAGYYSYKWAEVLSADAFGAFEDAGLDNPEAVSRVGRRFRDTVLAQGGSRHPMDIFRDFRGREPDPQALLRHSGLAP